MGSQESIYWTFLKNLAICFEHMAMDAEDIVIFRIIKSRSINIPTLEKCITLSLNLSPMHA